MTLDDGNYIFNKLIFFNLYNSVGGKIDYKVWRNIIMFMRQYINIFIYIYYIYTKCQSNSLTHIRSFKLIEGMPEYTYIHSANISLACGSEREARVFADRFCM